MSRIAMSPVPNYVCNPPNLASHPSPLETAINVDELLIYIQSIDQSIKQATNQTICCKTSRIYQQDQPACEMVQYYIF